MSGLRARTGTRTLLGLLAALALTATLAMPAFADHDPADGPAVTATAEDFPGGPPDCEVGQGVRFGNSPDDDAPLAEDAEATVDFDADSSATVKILSLDDDKLTFEVTGGLAATVFVKGGTDGQNVYDYSGLAGGGIAHDDGLVTPTTQGISHIDFCLVEATSTATATPTPTATATATATATQAGETATATATIREDTAGGNPTASPGDLPDTAMGEFGQVPATVLSLFLLASLAVMLYVRLARQR